MSARLYPLPTHQGLSPSSESIAASPARTLPIWRSIHGALRSFASRWFSSRASTPASSTPSASASQRRTSTRSRFSAGTSRAIGEALSRNPTITRESNSVLPSSSSSAGTLPSGLSFAALASAFHGSSISKSKSIFFSASTMRTLRVYGLASEPISFISGNSNTLGLRRAPQARSEPPAKLRQRFALEPGVLLHPEPVARAGMGQGEEFGQVFGARAHGFGEGFFPARAEVIGLGVAADEQREPDGGQMRAQLRMPVRRALGPRWEVARFARSRVTQAGGNDGDAALVVEILALDAQPFAQQIARGVVPGNAALVHAPARRLPHDEDARRGRSAQHRPRRVGKMLLADSAGPNFGEQALELGGPHPHDKIGAVRHTGFVDAAASAAVAAQRIIPSGRTLPQATRPAAGLLQRSRAFPLPHRGRDRLAPGARRRVRDRRDQAFLEGDPLRARADHRNLLRGGRRAGEGDRGRDPPRRQGDRVLADKTPGGQSGGDARRRVRAFRLHLRGHQQSRLWIDAERSAGPRAPARARSRDRDARGARPAARRRAHARAHARSARLADDARQGACERRPPAAARAARDRRGVPHRKDERRGRQLQRTPRGVPGLRLGALRKRLRRVPGAGIQFPYDADRTARLSRRAVRRGRARQHRAPRSRPRPVGLRLAGLFQTEDPDGRDRLLDHAAQDQSHRFREFRGQSRNRERAAAASFREVTRVALAARPFGFDGAA